MKVKFILFIIVVTLSVPCFAQFSKPSKSPHDIAYFRPGDKDHDGKPLLKVTYGRPQKNDRVIFGKLVPFGELWRLGANYATEIKFYNDLLFAGDTIKAGTYTMFAIPDEESWTIILNSELDQWGTFSYNSKKDVHRVVVPVHHTSTVIDSFSIGFTNAAMLIAWDKTIAEIPIALK